MATSRAGGRQIGHTMKAKPVYNAPECHRLRAVTGFKFTNLSQVRKEMLESKDLALRFGLQSDCRVKPAKMAGLASKRERRLARLGNFADPAKYDLGNHHLWTLFTTEWRLPFAPPMFNLTSVMNLSFPD